MAATRLLLCSGAGCVVGEHQEHSTGVGWEIPPLGTHFKLLLLILCPGGGCTEFMARVKKNKQTKKNNK